MMGLRAGYCVNEVTVNIYTVLYIYVFIKLFHDMEKLLSTTKHYKTYLD